MTVLVPIGTHEQAQTPDNQELQPKSTGELRRERRLARIAKALASGASVTEMPKPNVSANSPECRQLLAEFLSDENDDMRALF